MTELQNWLLGLGEAYGVNPVLFAVIYVGAIPFFTLSIGWLIRNIRARRPVTLPILAAGFFFISAYLYLLVAGRNIPLWVYVVVAAMVVYGVFATLKKVSRETSEV